MHFRFSAQQPHQLAALRSVLDLFDGHPRVPTALRFVAGTGLAAVANDLPLDEARLLQNLRAVQQGNGLPPDERLAWIEAPAETAEGATTARFPNFSVEMETGTGKTYVYLRTALELYRAYGLRKFIVVVHSVAVREGVLKTLRVTEAHLKETCGNPPYRFYAYDSANLTQVRQFALSDGVELMVMTIDAFNKASNVIRQSTDRLQGETPIHLVQAARPVLILDEPQNFESEARTQALAALCPLLALRYSATHRTLHNLVYRLTPYEAYRARLVKQIEVAGVEQDVDANRVFLRLDEVRTERRTLTARLAVHAQRADGRVEERVVTVRPGDGLEAKAGRAEYAPFVVEELDAGEGVVRFANGVELRPGDVRGADREAVFDAQIRYTIEEHFRKQRRLRERGVKVLSLFFLDRVDSYAADDGLVRRLFDRAFDGLKVRYPEWAHLSAEQVRAGYFAARRTRAGETLYEDSRSGESEKDREAYDLILRDKESLLSFPEPGDDEAARRKKQVAFLFSHSALREGWDNPNVFQLCTLNQTASEMKKRQEIGRGVRLAVDQTGERVHDPKVNVLTVVPNESYERYVAAYQAEVEQEWGAGARVPKPDDARRPGVARLRKEYTLRPEFRELWSRISRRTRYSVRLDSARLLADAVAELDRAEIAAPALHVRRARVEAENTDAAERFAAVQVAERVRELEPHWAEAPNVVELMAAMLEHASPPVRLTRRTLAELFRRTRQQAAALRNPHGFATTAVRILRHQLAEQLVAGVRYEPLDEWYEMSRLELDVRIVADYLEPSRRPDGRDGVSLYDQVVVESEVERRFMQQLERDERVKLYVKLPRWFTVPTPVGDYNPDWAVVLERRDEFGEPRDVLYLVRETKHTLELDELRPDEARRIRCGARYFGSRQFGTAGALDGLDYKLVTSASELE